MSGCLRLAAAAAAACIACAAPTLAADLGRPSTPVMPPAFSWTGVYLGVHGGYGWASSLGLDLSGDLAGGQLGFNYQMGNFVVGLEGDGSWADIFHDVSAAAPGVPPAATFANDTLASLRGRFGFAVDRVLVFATAGGGWGHGTLSGTVLGATVSSAAWHSGWSAGGGVEWAFFPNWTARLEYLHYGLGSATYFGTVNAGNLEADTFRAGFSYLFH
jgi:outer membrane immunogenic protein